MRIVLFVLAVAACEQGASPPAQSSVERFTIADDAQFARASFALFNEFLDIFLDSGSDCERLATRLEEHAERTATREAVIRAYALAHPTVADAAFARETDGLRARFRAELDVCMTDSRVTAAIRRVTLRRQRPR